MKKSNIKIVSSIFILITLFFIPFIIFADTPVTMETTITTTPTIIPTAICPSNFPFPINRDYANGIRITSYNPSTLQSLYNTWKSRYVVTASPGQRVISPEPINGVNNRTVSEGQAYGMLLAVYFADQTLFDNLLAFKIARSQGKTTGLMPWVIENNGTTIVDFNSASDADFDIAFALLMAHCQWGSCGTYNYQTLAATEIQRCRSYDINAGTYGVRPGDAWSDWGYPSYYFPAFFRVFGEFEGGTYQTTWNNVVARCLNNINTNRNTSSGLVGEICNVDTGTRRSDDPCSSGCNGTLYKYNSCRVPWRYATDWLWYGNATNSSGNEVSLLASFWNGIAPADVKDGYRIADNSIEGSVNNACFVGPAGCSLMYSSTYSSRLNEYYTRTLSFDVNESYYSGTLQLLSLLLMTGNFHNLCGLGVTPEQTGTQTSTITPTSTVTFTNTITPTPTMTATRTVTRTGTPTMTVTLTLTTTATFTNTVPPTPTQTKTAILTPETLSPTPDFTVIIDDIAGGADKGEQIIKLPDGKFLVVGIVWDDNCVCYISVIWKYNIDGTPDTTFGGGDGIMECPVPGTTFVWEDSISIYVDINGYIYVTGYVVGCGGTCKNLVVYRLKPDGTIDTSFGGTGYIIYTQVSVNISVSIHSYITFDSIGRMIITSKRWNGSNYDMIVIRCNPDGSLDTTFCSGSGYCTFDYMAGDNAGYKVYVDINFNIYIIGYVTIIGPGCVPSCQAIAVWKLLPDGTPDPSFNGGNCFVYYDVLKNHKNCIGYSLVVTITGEIYITGYVSDGSGCIITCKQMIVIKLRANGTIDTTFGTDGIYVFLNYPGEGRDIAFDSDGQLVIAGTIYNGMNTDIIIWKMLLNGTLDLSYRGQGYSIYDSLRDEWAKGLLVYALCTYLVTGYTDVVGSNYDMLIWFDGCFKYPTPTITRTPTLTNIQTIIFTSTPTFTNTTIWTLTSTQTLTLIQTSTPTQTLTSTQTLTPTPVLTSICDGVTPPAFKVKAIYDTNNKEYVRIEIESSVILQNAPIVDIYVNCGCPPAKYKVFSYTADLIPGETKKYVVLYPKNIGYGDIEKIIVKGTDICNVTGESEGAYTKETITKDDIVVYKNVIKPETGERTRIVFNIYGQGEYVVNVYNRNGTLIKGLFKENLTETTGQREVFWDGKNLQGKSVASGIYYVVVKTPYYEAKEKIVVLK